jgi:hypothetical protein
MLNTMGPTLPFGVLPVQFHRDQIAEGVIAFSSTVTQFHLLSSAHTSEISTVATTATLNHTLIGDIIPESKNVIVDCGCNEIKSN